MSPHIRITRDDKGVQTIRIDRPEKKNAIQVDMYAAMAEAIEDGEKTGSVLVTLFMGSNGIFTAGNDIADFIDFAKRGTIAKPILRFLRALVLSEKPLIAAVDGHAIGVGTTMLFLCDLVYASEQAEFRTPFLDLGLVPEAASSLLAPRLMGHARAFELLCLGVPFDADRAEEIGFVNLVVSAAKLEATAYSAALALARKPPEALKTARMLLKGERGELLARLDKEAGLFRQRLTSPEAQKALQAFMDKHPPETPS